jgi:signal transduction histidine kinase
VSRRRLIPRGWLGLPRGTIRLRLTVLYGALFLASGAALLTVTYLLVEHQYTANGASLFVSSGSIRGGGNVVRIPRTGTPILNPAGLIPFVPTPTQLRAVAGAQSTAALNQLLINSGIALAIMAVLSIWLGWLVAGRALAPLRTITNAARDISASSLHKRLALDGPDDEITQLGNTFDELLERLQASFEAQRQFAANASHELRTPLTLERTLVEVALADPGASLDSLRQMGERVLAAGEQQERLIEALLTLSRSQRGIDQHERIDLAATTRQVLETLDPNGLTVTTSLQPAWASGDPQLVERLIANLLTNAVSHNTVPGHIDVRTETRAGRAWLAVDNTGPPIPADQLERLFEPFQRLDGQRRNGAGGFGLGLSIVQAVATAHHATIDASANAGGGLQIEVGFPARTPANEQRLQPGEPAAAGASLRGTEVRLL